MEEVEPKNGLSSKEPSHTDHDGLAAAQRRLEGEGGYRIDPKLFAENENLKLSSDGRIVLIPQPSDDPKDPLNWSAGKKAVLLAVITAASFLPDYGSATGAVTLIPQAAYWKITVEEVSHSLAGNVFMLGVGGLFTVVLSAYFGRLPVLFWFMCCALLSAIWCAAAQTFDAFEAGRIVNGFFATVGQGGGLMWIQDVFFLHQHARKINIWALALVISPFVGPMLGAFMVNFVSWRWPYWVFSIEIGIVLVAIILFADEAYYDRSIPPEQQPLRQSRLKRLIGIEQWHYRHQRNTFLEACKRPIQALHWPVFIPCFFYLVTFAWSVGVNNALSVFLAAQYGFSPKNTGFFYFGPLIAILLGFAAGHFLNDWFATIYRKRHDGIFEPEARLWIVVLTAPIQWIGLILLGQALQNDWHFMLTNFAWDLFLFSLMVSTTGLDAYLLDSYPRGSGEMAAWFNVGRSTGGFIASYFELTWVTGMGPAKTFGIQAAISAAFLGTIVVLLVWGKQLRARGQANFKTT